MNVSRHPVQLLYGPIEEELASEQSQIPFDNGGLLLLLPAYSCLIELSRMDEAQLERLRDLRVINYSAVVVDDEDEDITDITDITDGD